DSPGHVRPRVRAPAAPLREREGTGLLVSFPPCSFFFRAATALRFALVFSGRSSVDLSPNALSIALSRARASGREVLDLTESNPTRAAIPFDGDAITRAFARREALVYEPAPFGLASAREAVARDLSAHGPAVDPSRVALTASTSEAYAFL